MDHLIASLADRSQQDKKGKLCVINDLENAENNVCTVVQVQAAQNRGWIAYQKTVAGWKPYSGSTSSGLGEIPYSQDLDNDTQSIYDMAGHQLNSLQQGINILLMKDGSTRKIIR